MATDLDVCLSSAGIKSITINKIEEDFVFLVEGQAYKCPRVIAVFLSLRACLSQFIDPSIAEYVVETRDLNDAFKLFMSLGSGSTIPVTQASLSFFLSLESAFIHGVFQCVHPAR
jgi:hypothetical protein